jgi:hypothetical protein
LTVASRCKPNAHPDTSWIPHDLLKKCCKTFD